MRNKKSELFYSICPICQKKIKAKLLFSEGKVFISKKCPIHGEFIEEHTWDDIKTYNFMISNFSSFLRKMENIPHGLIVDITSKCNLNCPLCFKKNYPEEDVSSILSKIKKATKKIRFSTIFLFGGEPTIREDLFYIIKELKKMNLDVSLFTNGIKLKDEEYVKKLKTIGLDAVTLSLDSLDDNVYKKLRGTKLLKIKLLALRNLKKFKIPTSLFVVVTNLNTTDDVVGIINLKLKFNNLHTIYLSTITKEGTYPKDILPISSSKRINIITRQFKIKKEEIYATTTFERLIVELLYKYLKKPLKYSSPFCDLVSYFYTTSKHIIPLTKIINLEAINEELSKEIIKKPSILRIPKIGGIIFKSFTFKSLFFKTSFLLFKNLLPIKKRSKISIPSLFLRIVITKFQDRYTLDLRSFKTCNLYALSKGGNIEPFCSRLIFEEENSSTTL
jgi:uncharacterized radical SAM superfamily Fe-S cluster-containing enzyme